jgi:hypothetical protein
MRVASWNILSDLDVPKHPSQANRLDEIAETIAKTRQDSARFLIYLCECVTKDNIDFISSEAGLVALGDPLRYNDDNEYGIFLADPQTASRAIPEEITIDNNHSVNWLNVGGLKILGCHMPWQFIRKLRQRRLHANKIIDVSPDILVGDLNSPPFFLMRKRFERAGYTEAHADDRPVFPHPSYRGINIPDWWPGMNLDVILHKDTVEVRSTGHSYSSASDHPIVWVDINKPSGLLK